MICKKVVKHKNNTKVEKNKKTIENKRRSKTLSSASGAKQTQIESKAVALKKTKSSPKKTLKDKKLSQKCSPNVKNLRFSAKKEINDNKSNNKSTIETIKAIGKKVKTKTCDKVKVIKRNLRNNSKIKSEIKETKMKDKNNDSVKSKTKTTKRSTNCVKNGEKEKVSLQNGSKKTTKSKLCSKLFPTFDCIKSSNNKSLAKNQKSENLDSKAKLRNYIKSETIDIKKEEQLENVSKNKEKNKSSVVKRTLNSNNKQKDKKSVKNKTKTVKQNSTKNKSPKAKNKSNKVKAKSSTKPLKDKQQKNGTTFEVRGHRLASLNATAKVRLLCENESEKNETIEESFNSCKGKQMTNKETNRKNDKRSDGKSSKKSDNSKALVPVDNSKKQLAVRKRKLIDDSIEIIPRSCKRMASLNASAIMAASYSPERFKRSKSVESNQSNSSVEMVREMQTYSHTVSRFETSVNGINGIHVNHVNQVSQQNSLILKAQKHETIETVKQLKVSNKIKDRLLGIARFEREEMAKQKKKDSKNQSSRSRDQSIGDQSLVPGGEVSGFQATNVQVTKVTHINTSQGVKNVAKNSKDKKSGHQIDSILESDSSVVHKYQVQTKATIQMQTTYNASDVPTIANVTTITATQPTATTGTGPRMQFHLADAQVIPNLNSGQPTYFNLGGPTPAVVQLHNNHYQTMGASTSSLTPMPTQFINLSDPYSTHYSSAFSVPHFATHSHPTQTPFNYFNAGLYQPAGPLLQAFQDPCLIHKPIPFHPPAPQVSHIHNSSQFPNSTQTNQTFATEMSQPFAASPQFYPQLQNPMQSPMRAPQTVFFQALPQPNATAFTLLNPGVPYTHPTIINSEQFMTNRENPVLANDSSFLNQIKINTNNTNHSVTQTSNDRTRQNISKSIQCSPQSRDHLESTHENRFCDSTNSSVRLSDNRIPVVSVESQTNRKSHKSDHRFDKKKKSLFLKTNKKNSEEVLIRNNSSQSVPIIEQNLDSMDNMSNALTPSKSLSTHKTNSNKQMKAVCVHINTSLPSVSAPSTPSPSNRHLPLKKSKKRFSHGWSWEGSPQHKYVYLNVSQIQTIFETIFLKFF